MCVKAGGNQNAKDRKGGQTPLYLAAAAKQWDCVKYLLESGADSSIPCQVRKGGGGPQTTRLRPDLKPVIFSLAMISMNIKPHWEVKMAGIFGPKIG